jgi:hypothetical protein
VARNNSAYELHGAVFQKMAPFLIYFIIYISKPVSIGTIFPVGAGDVKPTDHTPPNCDEVKKTRIYTSTHLYVFMA